ncbi:hypothetical protein CB017_001915 [Salmonella enterica]|nr:hypothetical protein [Salmonella enterica]EBZ6264725.1 hypothetical protein [Salmonella enterica subsp. enterica serovar Oranienburg]ECA1471341.1 hypothetical protein [Salmonella enterica subsp. enterica serovar Oranienburg]ECA8997392.1 hypothetical protein [Salmonella enterica subsp. enterica serovar Oranienburg]ECA9344761.1 hypothetical protein [Salmonella enterica subsp. enterica serovar Oranienburg]
MKYVPAVLTDLILAAALAVGIGLNIEGITATAHGVLWVFAVAIVLAYLSPSVLIKAEKEYIHRPLLWAVYDLISDIAFVAVAACLNWYVLAVFLLAGLALKQDFCSKQEKRLKEQAV